MLLDNPVVPALSNSVPAGCDAYHTIGSQTSLNIDGKVSWTRNKMISAADYLMRELSALNWIIPCPTTATLADSEYVAQQGFGVLNDEKPVDRRSALEYSMHTLNEDSTPYNPVHDPWNDATALWLDRRIAPQVRAPQPIGTGRPHRVASTAATDQDRDQVPHGYYYAAPKPYLPAGVLSDDDPFNPARNVDSDVAVDGPLFVHPGRCASPVLPDSIHWPPSYQAGSGPCPSFPPVYRCSWTPVLTGGAPAPVSPVCTATAASYTSTPCLDNVAYLPARRQARHATWAQLSMLETTAREAERARIAGLAEMWAPERIAAHLAGVRERLLRSYYLSSPEWTMPTAVLMQGMGYNQE
ncbi:hypothetical protein GGX14DRAFT_633693 [Mycena pura]|uniref:Uncharacterized protein n=1 Tax=Mycena pura TaxID=153505 RepID=A0AAD6VBG5_9AGAR|nr:hypothetical protein GGX14DRAFT_633693 [Mycena pura]